MAALSWACLKYRTGRVWAPSTFPTTPSHPRDARLLRIGLRFTQRIATRGLLDGDSLLSVGARGPSGTNPEIWLYVWDYYRVSRRQIEHMFDFPPWSHPSDANTRSHCRHEQVFGDALVAEPRERRGGDSQPYGCERGRMDVCTTSRLEALARVLSASTARMMDTLPYHVNVP